MTNEGKNYNDCINIVPKITIIESIQIISQILFWVVTINRDMKTKTYADFDDLIQRHHQEIFSYLWRLMRDPMDAEDALQETYLRAFRAFSRIEDDAHLRAWLYKIATNVANTMLKKRNRLASRTTDLMEFISVNPNEFELFEQLEAVFQTVEKLPYKQKVALILRNFHGLPYEEIGLTLDCSPEAARANVYQAIKKLRKNFAEESNHEH
jgi:RNA polymerase sigma-70 factor (ECF subfamily)